MWSSWMACKRIGNSCGPTDLYVTIHKLQKKTVDCKNWLTVKCVLFTMHLQLLTEKGNDRIKQVIYITMRCFHQTAHSMWYRFWIQRCTGEKCKFKRWCFNFHTVCFHFLKQRCGRGTQKDNFGAFLGQNTRSLRHLKTIWSVTWETIKGYFLPFIPQLASSETGMPFIQLDLFIFLKNHVYFSIISLAVVLFFYFYKKLFYLNFSWINCSGANDLTVTPCFREKSSVFSSCGA